MKRLIVVLGVIGLLGLPQGEIGRAQSSPDKPNILVIVTDDQRADTMRLMPNTRANFDVAFATAVVTTPNCCPSRASILTGRYARNHGVLSNAPQFAFSAFRDNQPESLGPWLQQQGYHTGFVGKYLHHFSADDPTPPGWDEFHAYVWGVTPMDDIYREFALRQTDALGDEVVTYPNEDPNAYSTDVFATLASRFIHRAHDSVHNPENKPWALIVFPNAPNRPYTVASRHRGHPVPKWDKPPSYLREPIGKPREVWRSPMRLSTYGFTFPQIRRQQLRTLLAVDDLVLRAWQDIDHYGEREDTWGIFSSDNGVAWGEHQLAQKLHAYEQQIRVPFRMAVPATGARVVRDALVANIDIAPTLLEVAGGGLSSDGTSLAALAVGGDTRCFCGRGVVIENMSRWINYDALRTPRWKYVRWASGRHELYNMARDRWELRNIASRRPRRVRWAQQKIATIKARD